MENEIQQLRNRVTSLQADLETSEAVQRDFVQLSQQLQVVTSFFTFCIMYLKEICHFISRFNWKKFASQRRN